MAKERNESLYRKIVRKTWRRKRFRRLPERLKLVLLYLWTAPDSDNPGIYEITIAAIADDLGCDTGIIRESFAELIKGGWFLYDDDERVIFFPRWFEYDPPHNQNVVKSYLKHLNNLPKTALRSYFLTTLLPYCDDWKIDHTKHTAITPESLLNDTLNTSESVGIQEQEQEQEQIRDAATPPDSELVSEQDKAVVLGILGITKIEPVLSGDVVAAIKKWIGDNLPGLSGNIGMMAGKAYGTLVRQALGKQWEKNSPEGTEFFTTILELGLGNPKTESEFYAHLETMCAKGNGLQLHEYIHEARRRVRAAESTTAR